MRRMKKRIEPTILIFWEKDKEYVGGKSFAVPNMAAFVRDVTEYGNIGAIMRRAIKLSIPSIIKMAWWNKFNVLKLIKKDFAAGVSILVQMEILQILKYQPRLIALTDQVSDLAVALGNRQILTQYMNISKQVGMPPCIVTNNLIDTIQLLSELKFSGVSIVTPFNSYGFEMNPSQAKVEQMMRMIDPQNIYALSPIDDKREDKYLSRFGIQKKVLQWF